VAGGGKGPGLPGVGVGQGKKSLLGVYENHWGLKKGRRKRGGKLRGTTAGGGGVGGRDQKTWAFRKGEGRRGGGRRACPNEKNRGDVLELT